MERMDAVNAVAGNDLLANRYELERQLHVAAHHYAAARKLADQLRDEWRAQAAHPSPKAELIEAARGRFQAVAARCRRLLNVIDELEARLD